MHWNGRDDAPSVETPEDERLPSVPDVRYGAFDVDDGTTVVFDRELEDGWVRADCAVAVVP